MKLITKAVQEQLQANHDNRNKETLSPVVKLFTPWGSATWLLTDIDANGILFGLCDLGLGTPELGYVDLQELQKLRGPGGLRVERDRHFEPAKTLDEYATEARQRGYVIA